jgi:hypothetical protein
MTTGTETLEVEVTVEIEALEAEVNGWDGRGKCPVCKDRGLVSCPCRGHEDCGYCDGEGEITCPCQNKAWPGGIEEI